MTDRFPFPARLSFAVALCVSGVVNAAGEGPRPVNAPEATLWPPAVSEPLSGSCSSAIEGRQRTFHVGPGKQFEELNEVPWLSLGAGDVVNIHHRQQPYRTKFGLRSRGTMEAPIVINGVTSASCERPEISGRDATTASDAAKERFFNKQHSENLGVVFIYRASSDPWSHRPAHITIQNLKISGAHKSNRYVAQDGSAGTYALGAAGVYAVRVEGLRVENNEITGNGNGVFVNSKGDDDFSENITIRRNVLHGNGNVGSYTEHNLYIQARRPLYEGNHIGQLIAGARGSSMKDRSSASVIRYNHIVAAARAIDLVEIEGGVGPVRSDPLYPHAWVYGNLIVSDHNLPSRASSLLIHWGGDNDPRYFRNGTLYFFNNTVVTRASQAQAYYLSVFDMPTAHQTVLASANVFVHEGSSALALGYKSGRIVLRDTNWIARGWLRSWAPEVSFDQTGGTVLEGPHAGLDASHVPTPGSPVADRGASSLDALPAPVGPSNLAVSHQYTGQASLTRRSVKGKALDAGAFEGL